MSFATRPRAVLTGAIAAAVTLFVPGTAPFVAGSVSAQPFAAEFLPATARATAAALGSDILPTLLADEGVTHDTIADDAADVDAAAAPLGASDEDLVCLAKAVQHEAGGQARDGQLAVAQLIVNRMRSGRFAGTICGVVNQQGQFFHTAAYNPNRASPVWAGAMAVAREALTGATPGVAPGALFFHAAYQAPTGFFRGRQRVALLGGNIFYR